MRSREESDEGDSRELERLLVSIYRWLFQTEEVRFVWYIVFACLLANLKAK